MTDRVVSEELPPRSTREPNVASLRAVGGSKPEALPSFEGVRTRLLHDHERPYPAQDARVPLVIEAKAQRSQSFLEAFLAANGEAVVRAAYQYGAVLLRGFEVASEHGYGQAISSLRPLRPMGGYFMSEEGRTPVERSSVVFHTNTHYRTGSSFSQLGDNFHSENYYSTDVPAFQCFWCKQASGFGGETGLSHMSRAYAELSDELRARLESDGICTVSAWSIAKVAKRYSLSEDFIEQFFRDLGFPITVDGGTRYLVLEKPVVLRHPHSEHKSFQANLAGELPELRALLYELLLPNYEGPKWALHRYAWKHPRLRRVLSVADTLPGALRPTSAAHYLKAGLLDRLRPEVREERLRTKRLASGSRLSEKLSSADVRALTTAVWRHSSVFSWRRGDVLILDNLQMLHAGMPGLGPRELRAMLCNPIALKYPLASGPAWAETSPEYISVDERLTRASSAAKQRAPTAMS